MIIQHDDVKEVNTLPSKVMLTTTDNPFNPFTQYDQWYAFDMAQGYNSCAYLARIAKSSDSLSELEELSAIESAIDEIVHYNILGIYVKVTPETWTDRSEKGQKYVSRSQ